MANEQAIGKILLSEWDRGFARTIFPPLPCEVCGTPMQACTHDFGFIVAAQNQAYRDAREGK